MKEHPQKPQPIDPENIGPIFLEKQNELEQEIDALVANVDAEYAFQALVAFCFCQLIEDQAEAEYSPIPALVELAAFYLYPHFGQVGPRDPGQIQALIDALMKHNEFRGLAAAFSVNNCDNKLASLQVQTRVYAELVRGSSYPPQMRRRIENIQGPFERWFHINAGIGPLKALEVLDACIKVMNANFHSHRLKLQEINARRALVPRLNKTVNATTTVEIECQRIAIGMELAKFIENVPFTFQASFEQVSRIVSGLKREEWEAMRHLIGFTPEVRKRIQQPHEMKEHPLYFLSGDRLVYIDISSVYDSLFDAFDRCTRTVMSFRDRHYILRQKQWMEGEVCDFLRRLFPPQAVYQELTYSDPDNNGGETELDAAVVWGPFLVLVEVKGKQFRPRSRIGDLSKLRADLRDNIEEAFEQAQRATRFVEANTSATFVEKHTGRKLCVQKDSVFRIFQLSVTLHYFSGLATQPALLKRLGLFKDSTYPWSVSLSDLDIITKFSGNPDVFLHYVQRRFDLQQSEKNIMGHELDVFGLYLDTRLHPSQFWERKIKDGILPTLLILFDGSHRFDKWYKAEQGVCDERPEIRLKLPPRFSAIIEELRLRNDNGARWIAFSLLGLSQNTISTIEGDLDNLRAQAKPDGRPLRITINDNGLVISIVAARGMATNELHRHTEFRACIEKYRRKASASLSLGINTNNTLKPFDYAFWIEGPWKADPVFDELLQMERPNIMPGQKLPGRNDPCLCGSGKKFKKCCLDKVSPLSN